jgi:hypothetical protein
LTEHIAKPGEPSHRHRAIIASMRSTVAIFTALVFVGGCGGRQMLDLPPADGNATVAPPSITIGPVDGTQAPAQLSMSCDTGVGAIAIDNPCLVGFSIGGGVSKAGAHEVECTLAASNHPIAWSFLLVLPVTQNPVTVFPETPSAAPVDLGGRQVHASSTTGTLTFSRVDPSNQAFVAQFDGVVTWTASSGATFSCSVDGPLWGTPGAFE